MSRAARAGAYGSAGLAAELAFTGIRGRRRTSLWMLPVYALAAPLFEPLHDRLRGKSLAARMSAYAAGFSLVEYGSGRALRRQFEPALDDFARELSHFRATVVKAADVAGEGWRLLDETLGEREPRRYQAPHQTSPF